jgi:hypothetical protein
MLIIDPLFLKIRISQVISISSIGKMLSTQTQYAACYDKWMNLIVFLSLSTHPGRIKFTLPNYSLFVLV